jgi:hypothetical protein
MGVTNLPGELETKANGRRGQRAGMLSRSWLRFVLITTLNIATGPRARQLASGPSGAPRTDTSRMSPFWPFADVRAAVRNVRFLGKSGPTARDSFAGPRDRHCRHSGLRHCCSAVRWFGDRGGPARLLRRRIWARFARRPLPAPPLRMLTHRGRV